MNTENRNLTNNIRWKVIYLFLFLIFISSCSYLKYHSWQDFENTKLGFSIKVPEKPRHFTMSSDFSLSNQSFDQWTIEKSDSKYQFFILTSEYDPDQFSELMVGEQLDKVDRPNLGFLKDGVELSKNRVIENDFIMEEQHWDLAKKREKAITQTYLRAGRLIQLICVYPANIQKPDRANYFFSSFQFK